MDLWCSNAHSRPCSSVAIKLYANGGPLTGCLCSPIAQNHELTELACEDLNIVDDYIGHELSYDALK